MMKFLIYYNQKLVAKLFISVYRFYSCLHYKKKTRGNGAILTKKCVLGQLLIYLAKGISKNLMYWNLEHQGQWLTKNKYSAVS